MSSPSSRRAPVPLGSSCTIPFAIAASMVLLSSLVGAVDLLFCTQNHCGGRCVGCLDVPENDCCLPTAGVPALSVDAKNADIDRPARISFYVQNVGCDEPPRAARRGVGNTCMYTLWQPFTGAKWARPPPPPPPSPPTNRRLQSADISEIKSPAGHMYSNASADISEIKPSAGYMHSNAAFFTEPGMEGRWVLPIANFTEYFSQVNDLSDAETLDWFKSQGAYYKP